MQKHKGQSRATDPGQPETLGQSNPLTASPQIQAQLACEGKPFAVQRELACLGDILPDVFNTLAERLERNAGHEQ